MFEIHLRKSDILSKNQLPGLSISKALVENGSIKLCNTQYATAHCNETIIFGICYTETDAKSTVSALLQR